MLRPDRTPRGEDPMLLPKMATFFIAAMVAVYGMATERPWVIFGAIVILGVGFLLRFVRRPAPRNDLSRDDEADDTPQRPD